MMHNIFALALLCVGGEVLLIKCSAHVGFGKGLYGLVGGKVEQGERVLQAVKREVYEETGNKLLNVSHAISIIRNMVGKFRTYAWSLKDLNRSCLLAKSN